MNDVFLRQMSQWNNAKDNRNSPRVSLRPTAMKHLCLPGSGKHTARHHSCKMSSGASSKAERLTLIHKQLPLSLCCRFRTAVPPNISLSCLANIEKKKKKRKTARLPSLLRKKGKHKSREERAGPRKSSNEEAIRQKENKSRGQKACNI